MLTILKFQDSYLKISTSAIFLSHFQNFLKSKFFISYLYHFQKFKIPIFYLLFRPFKKFRNFKFFLLSLQSIFKNYKFSL